MTARVRSERKQNREMLSISRWRGPPLSTALYGFGFTSSRVLSQPRRLERFASFLPIAREIGESAACMHEAEE